MNHDSTVVHYSFYNEITEDYLATKVKTSSRNHDCWTHTEIHSNWSLFTQGCNQMQFIFVIENDIYTSPNKTIVTCNCSSEKNKFTRTITSMNLQLIKLGLYLSHVWLQRAIRVSKPVHCHETGVRHWKRKTRVSDLSRIGEKTQRTLLS